MLVQPSMVQFECQAREFLLTRRHRLRRQVAPSEPILVVAGVTGSTPRRSPSRPARRRAASWPRSRRRSAAHRRGRYGTCLACGGPMGLQRIRAIPEARYCVGCSGQGLEAE